MFTFRAYTNFFFIEKTSRKRTSARLHPVYFTPILWRGDFFAKSRGGVLFDRPGKERSGVSLRKFLLVFRFRDGARATRLRPSRAGSARTSAPGRVCPLRAPAAPEGVRTMPRLTPTAAAGSEKILLSTLEVAVLLGCSVKHVRRLAARGELPPPVRLGHLVRWSRQTLEEFFTRPTEKDEKSGK
jgi:excisionase family DNA binding protein